MNNDDVPDSPVTEEHVAAELQKEADRFNQAMKVRRLQHRARIDLTPTPHFVIEPPLPPEMVNSNYESIFAEREQRRESLVDHRDHTADPKTVRRLDMMIDNHDRGTDRIQSHEPVRKRRSQSSNRKS